MGLKSKEIKLTVSLKTNQTVWQLICKKGNKLIII